MSASLGVRFASTLVSTLFLPPVQSNSLFYRVVEITLQTILFLSPTTPQLLKPLIVPSWFSLAGVFPNKIPLIPSSTYFMEDLDEYKRWQRLSVLKTTMRYYLTPIRMAAIKKQTTQNITSVGVNLEKLEPLCAASKNVKWSIHYGREYGGSSKNKIEKKTPKTKNKKTTLKLRSAALGPGRKRDYFFGNPKAGGKPGSRPLIHFTKRRGLSKAGLLDFKNRSPEWPRKTSLRL